MTHQTLSAFDAAAILIVLAATLGYFNHRVIRLPSSVGLTVMGTVAVPLKALSPILYLGPLALPTLVWGGLRGGISVALALSLPDGPARTIILTAAYVVVLFAVVVQGGSIGKLIKKLSEPRFKDM